MSKIYPTPNQVKKLALAIDETEMEKIQTRLKDYTGDGCIILLDSKPSPASVKELERSGWKVFQETKIKRSSSNFAKELVAWGTIVCYPTVCVTLGIAGIVISCQSMWLWGWLSLLLYPTFVLLLARVAMD